MTHKSSVQAERKERGRQIHDIMDKSLNFAVFVKQSKRRGNRVCLLMRPTTKQLRRAGRRGWKLVEAQEPTDVNVHGLNDVVTRAVKQLMEPEPVNGQA